MIRYYGVILGLVVGAGSWLIRRGLAESLRPIWDKYYPLLLILALIGARAYHVVDQWSYYRGRPQEVVFVWQGGLSYWGALVGLGLGLMLIKNIHRLDWWRLTDPVFTYLPLMQAFGRLANWVNSEIVGWPTSGWGGYLPPSVRPPGMSRFDYYQPVFWYEAGLNLALFGLIWLIRRVKPVRGYVTAVYLAGYGLIRVGLEFVRLPVNSFVVAGVNINLILAIWMTLAGVGLGWYLNRRLTA